MKRIAIVEDNPDYRLSVCALLEGDYELVTYENGQQALSGLTSDRPDLVLLDLSLPGIDGCAVLAEIRRTQPLSTLPVIALTTCSMNGNREKCLEHGFDGSVNKPIEGLELLAAIHSLLGSH